MNIISGIGESGFLAQSALSAEIATKDNLGRNISETYLTGVDLTPYQTTAGMTAYAQNSALDEKLDTSVYATDSAMFSGAIDYVSANISDPVTSPLGTILVNGSEVEATNSAVATANVEGFVSSFGAETVGPYGTASFSWDKSLPNTIFTFTPNYPPPGTIITYSANTNSTGEILAQGNTAIPLSIDIPNATALNIWTVSNWFQIIDCSASAADSIGMTVGELAWASALPTYQYDSSNKISAINGSALANYELPQSATEAIENVTANSATWNTVSDKLDSSAFSDVSGNFLTAVPTGTMYESAFGYDSNSKISGYNGSAFALSGNYIPYTGTEDSLTAFKTNSGLLIERTAVGLNSTYIVGGLIQLNNVGGVQGPEAVLSPRQLTFEANSDSAYVDKEKIHIWDSASDYIQNSSATINEVNTSYQTNSGNFLTSVDLTPYQTTAGMTAYQSAGDYLTTADSANFYTTANESGYITAVPDTYLQNTDLEISDNKITGISGVPLAAGGDVPEGVMVESGLEYNAVNEISGYNGSAIAQYGAEKQWLTHDDTIVHVSNSAQYAFGVNVPVVAQQIGADETVLFSGEVNATTATANLSEPISSFNRIKMLCKLNRSTPVAAQWFEFTTDTEYYTMLGGLTNANTTAGKAYMGEAMVSLSGGVIDYYNGKQLEWGSTAVSNSKNASIYQVVGIGRKN